MFVPYFLNNDMLLLCVCVEHLNRCKTSSAVLVCRGQWPTHESTANEATHELGGYRD